MASTRRFTRFALTGHSGAELTLIEADGETFVRKRARAPEQSARLRQQCDKLREAHAAGIACPAVYRTDDDGELFSFEMEFVPGDSLAHALLSGREPEWSVLLPQITGLTTRYCETGHGDIPANQFVAKLDAIAAGCTANPAAHDALAQIGQVVATLKERDWSGIPASQSHGDLTLENLLVRQDGHIVFIDFDVPEQSSWWLDIAKLFQDLTGHWCLRHLVLSDPEGIEALNAQLAMSRAAAGIAPLLAKAIPGGEGRLAPLIAFHLLRTLPYARQPLVVDYVLQRIGAVLES
jgi:tRNA A-37 threonylcarbamoyl transferase component Bud32